MDVEGRGPQLVECYPLDVGAEIVALLTWKVFKENVMDKYCNERALDKIEDEFRALKKETGLLPTTQAYLLRNWDWWGTWPWMRSPKSRLI